MEVPTTSTFDEIYPEDAVTLQKKRWNNLLSQFEQKYGRKADFISRSPGRVNIMGEHVDYSLYQCLPMAVTADVLLAISINKTDGATPRMRIGNVHATKFPAREFDIPASGEIEIDAKTHEWSSYFKSGLRGALGHLKKTRSSSFKPAGMDILVDGNVPAGGGLSSSAAFVCASALAVLKANGEKVIDKTELVELAVVSERAVGVNSGGLDQAASVFALRDAALLVSFKPSLTATPVPLPALKPALVFVIAQSLVVSNKQVTGPVHYNLRVVEVTLAAQYLAKIFRLSKPLPEDAGPLGSSLRGFHDAYFEENDKSIVDNTQASREVFEQQLEKLVQLTEDYLVQEDGYTREDVATVLGISVDQLNERYASKVPIRAERFMLRQRALHVFSEALRVQRFMNLLNSRDEDPESLPQKMGDLINQVQDSCRDQYECSCPELDELCRIARRAGSYGGRLTGAGWGGCSVHLVPEGKVEAVKDAWRKEYYLKKWPEMSSEELDDAVVVSRPGRGSLIFEVEGRGSV